MKELLQKLASIYGEISHIDKRGKNSFQNYSYVKASDVAHAVRNALAPKNVYVQTSFDITREYTIPAKEGVMQAIDVRCTLFFHDADSGQSLAVNGYGSGADKGDKAIFKAQTGSLKSALRYAFLIPDDNDPEADERVDQETEERHTSTPKPKRAETTKKAAVPETVSEIPENKPTRAEVPPAPSEALTGVDEEAHRNKFRLLVADLSSAGLTASASPRIPVAQKLLTYLFQTTGATSKESITATQWATFWSVISAVKSSDGGIKELVRLVETASKPKKENA